MGMGMGEIDDSYWALSRKKHETCIDVPISSTHETLMKPRTIPPINPGRWQSDFHPFVARIAKHVSVCHWRKIQ